MTKTITLLKVNKSTMSPARFASEELAIAEARRIVEKQNSLVGEVWIVTIQKIVSITRPEARVLSADEVFTEPPKVHPSNNYTNDDEEETEY